MFGKTNLLPGFMELDASVPKFLKPCVTTTGFLETSKNFNVEQSSLNIFNHTIKIKAFSSHGLMMFPMKALLDFL